MGDRKIAEIGRLQAVFVQDLMSAFLGADRLHTGRVPVMRLAPVELLFGVDQHQEGRDAVADRGDVPFIGTQHRKNSWSISRYTLDR